MSFEKTYLLRSVLATKEARDAARPSNLPFVAAEISRALVRSPTRRLRSLLTSEGVKIARRTVSKYARNDEPIPPSTSRGPHGGQLLASRQSRPSVLSEPPGILCPLGPWAHAPGRYLRVLGMPLAPF